MGRSGGERKDTSIPVLSTNRVEVLPRPLGSGDLVLQLLRHLELRVAIVEVSEEH